jgi:hypothetical protein
MPLATGTVSKFFLYDVAEAFDLDYGAISVALTRLLPDTWEQLLRDGVRWHEDPRLAAGAEEACRALLARLQPAMSRPRSEFLSEDYLVFVATAFDDASSAEALIAARGATIAQLLRGEVDPLSADERCRGYAVIDVTVACHPRNADA